MTAQAQTNIKTQISLPRLMLHLEGLIVFLSSIALYWQIGANGWLFILLLFAPDLAFIPYMFNKSIGVRIYNIAHTYTLSISLAVISLLVGWQLGIALGLIWTAHIGLDRLMGYGLKYQADFKDTHLTRL